MKTVISAVIGFLFLASGIAWAEEQKKPAEDTYEYDNIVANLSGVGAPFVSGDYIVFTAENNARNIGIAFDFENFKKIHYFNLQKRTNYEGEVTSTWFFYIVKKPIKTRQVSYRLIIDGLWTPDPNNERTVFDEKEGITLSQVIIPTEDPAITEVLPNGLTHFVCFAKPGQNVRIGGTFTNWDSWIYSMREVIPGRYEIDIPLQTGLYYYAYYIGMTQFIDETNPDRGYSTDGKVVSCITVK